MKFLLAACLFLPVLALAQSYNLDFEQLDSAHLPAGWPYYRNTGTMAADSVIVKHGKYALRVERRQGDANQFIASAIVVPVTFKGKTIRYCAWVKTESTGTGFANLYMRADDEEPVAFINTQNKIPPTSGWTRYDISFTLPARARMIIAGWTLSGQGRMWIDSASLLVDGVPVETLAKTRVFRFDRQKELPASSVSLPPQLTAGQLENLQVLSKVWGFIKYFHQQAATGRINMDSCLFALMPGMLQAKDRDSRSSLLLQWLNGLGLVEACSTCGEQPGKKIFREPGIRWMENEGWFTAALRSRLAEIYKNRNTAVNYYVDAAPAGNPDFSNEAKYRRNVAGDDGMRLLALFRYWNSVEYFFPSKYLTAANWDSVLTAFIPLFLSARTELGYKLACAKLTAAIHDTHAANIFKDSTYNNYFGRLYLPVSLGFIKDRLVVDFYMNDSCGRVSGLAPGDEVLSVNSIPVSRLVDSLKPFIAASNRAALYRDIAGMLARSRDRKGMLEIKRDRVVKKLEVQYYNHNELGKAPRYTYTSIYPMYKKLDQQTGYINLEKIRADSLPVIFTALKDTKGIVIDIRNYPSDFMPFAMGNYLKGEQTPFAQFTYSNYTFPGRLYWTEPLVNGTVHADHYKGRIAILVNEQTQSQAEYTAMALRTAPGAVVIGSQTAGADGNVSEVFIPGGLSSWISGLGVYYPDGTPTQGIGIIPDIICTPTMEGIKAGRDELLERAVQWIDRGK